MRAKIHVQSVALGIAVEALILVMGRFSDSPLLEYLVMPGMWFSLFFCNAHDRRQLRVVTLGTPDMTSEIRAGGEYYRKLPPPGSAGP